jgi:endonuclease YncB( thermonuclease family)
MMLVASISVHAEILKGSVVGVSDGDTITVLGANHEQHKIRVAGIDAPKKTQPFGQRSKGSMSTLVFGKDVDVQWSKRDRYQRIVGKVLVTDPTCEGQCPKTLDAGLAPLATGLAWWYRKYAKEQSAKDAQRYQFAEQEARSHDAGLWSDGQPMPPWDWRKAAR